MKPVVKIDLLRFNPSIICTICRGYFVDATTVTECMDTFCKSCIVQYLRENKDCPKCKTVIHPTNPMMHIRLDVLKQDIIFKLMPELKASEMDRESKFYQNRNSGPNVAKATETTTERNSILNKPTQLEFDDPEGMVIVRLEIQAIGEPKFIRLDGNATIKHLKLYVSEKYQMSDMDVLCKGALMGNSHTLTFVRALIWKDDATLRLEFHPHIGFH